jgi:hypothetical protein
LKNKLKKNMGEFLSVPNKEKVSEDGESTKVL